MAYTGEFKVYEDIIQEMSVVYQHDKRPWMIGFSGGKDSTLLCCLVMEMLQRLPVEKRNKTVYIVSSDTMVENPIVRDYMHRMSDMINNVGAELNVKAESTYRANNIRSREIEGKLLVPHNDIENAYVYNPLTEIPNEDVWKFLLKGDAISPWGSDNKYLFSLYQGENLGEEQSVIGEIDKDKIPVTGNSRFGCWICTMVKEDKSLKAFIDKGEKWLIPLRDYRNWMLELRTKPGAREYKRRNGTMYRKADGNLGEGPFTMDTRQEMLRRLLQLEVDTGLSLITLEELKNIDLLWDSEGDLTRRKLVDIYFEVTGKRLPWDQYKMPVFPAEIIDEIRKLCDENQVEFELISKLIIEIEANKNYTKSSMVAKAFDRILNQGWLHFDSIEKGLNNEN